MRIVVIKGRATILFVLAGAFKHDREDGVLVCGDATEPHHDRNKAAASRSSKGLLVEFDL